MLVPLRNYLVTLASLMLCSGFMWQPAPSSKALTSQWKGYLEAAQSDTSTMTMASGLPYENCFQQAARSSKLPGALLQAVARGESNFDARAVSHAGALGVMQILWPGTARDLGVRTKRQAFTPCTNIDAGARYLRQMIDRYDGNLHAALIAYNRGPANVDRLLKAGRLEHKNWYSAYVWDHLGFVLNRNQGSSSSYAASGRLVFITFKMPFRAQDLITLLRATAPQSRFDWFKHANGGFAVSLHYENAAQRNRGKQHLQQMGLLRRE